MLLFAARLKREILSQGSDIANEASSILRLALFKQKQKTPQVTQNFLLFEIFRYIDEEGMCSLVM